MVIYLYLSLTMVNCLPCAQVEDEACRRCPLSFHFNSLHVILFSSHPHIFYTLFPLVASALSSLITVDHTHTRYEILR